MSTVVGTPANPNKSDEIPVNIRRHRSVEIPNNANKVPINPSGSEKRRINLRKSQINPTSLQSITRNPKSQISPNKPHEIVH